MKNHYELESWVSKSGKVVVLGEAAHPFPVCSQPSHCRLVLALIFEKIISLHAYSIAIEDGAFIGKIFSHTHNPARIMEFLHAFQENRYVEVRQVVSCSSDKCLGNPAAHTSTCPKSSI
jgi:salicylate hydroxylase